MEISNIILKNDVGNARPKESDLHPISPKTFISQE